jgi:hypothetical protein
MEEDSDKVFSNEDILAFKSQLARYYELLRTINESELGRKLNVNISVPKDASDNNKVIS